MEVRGQAYYGKRQDVDRVDREIRDMCECTESVSEADKGNGRLRDGEAGTSTVYGEVLWGVESDSIRGPRNKTVAIAIATEACKLGLNVPVLESE